MENIIVNSTAMNASRRSSNAKAVCFQSPSVVAKKPITPITPQKTQDERAMKKYLIVLISGWGLCEGSLFSMISHVNERRKVTLDPQGHIGQIFVLSDTPFCSSHPNPIFYPISK